MSENIKVIVELRHGFQMTITGGSDRMTIKEVCDMLAEAMQRFIFLRDQLKVVTYAHRSHLTSAKKGRRGIGSLELSFQANENESNRAVALWADAVINVYTIANSLEQMLELLSAYQERAKKEGGWLLEVVNLLDKPNGDLQALKVMMTAALLRDQQAGHYKPGVLSENRKQS